MTDGRVVRVISIGPGGPDQLTVEAVAALRDVDVFLVPDKDIEDLVALREQIVARHTDGSARVVRLPDPKRDRDPADYDGEVHDWHQARADQWAAAIAAEPAGTTVGFLAWGDPALYDSVMRVLDRIGTPYDVVPGVSSVQLLTARHRIPLNRVGESVVLTTGRRLAERVERGDTDLVVMLDGSLHCADLEGAWDIWWGANLGTSDEQLVAGRLDDVLPEIRAARERAKVARGWVMDLYLLRRVV